MEIKIDGIENKHIYVILKTGRVYTGEVTNCQNGIIVLNDKFDKIVMFSVDDISSLEVQDGR